MSQNKDGFKVKALLIAGLQLIAMLSVMTTMNTPVQAAGVPATINGDWVISSNQTYWGGICDLNGGNLIINANATLTLNRATINFNPTNYGGNGIVVHDKGKLVAEDALFQSGNGNRYTWVFEFGGMGDIKNSTITDVGDGNGAPIVIQSTGVILDGNDISNGDQGVFVDGRTAPIAPKLLNNNIHDMDGFAIETVNSAAPIEGNIINNNNAGANAFTAVMLLSVAPSSFKNNKITNNGGGGLVVAGITTAEIWDCQFGNPSNDIMVEGLDAITGSGAQTNVIAYNTIYQSAVVNTLAAQGTSEAKSTFKPMWDIDIKVKRDSTKAPVPGATVEVQAKDGTKLVQGLTTGPGGLISDVWVPQLKMEHKGGAEDTTTTVNYAPHVVWASADLDGKSIRSNATASIDKSGIMINVTLDDFPPPLTVTSPSNGFRTNETGVDITGATEPGAYLTIKGTPITLNADGSFDKYLGLLEGKNQIPVQSTDASGNQVTVNLEVIRDTQAPLVKIATPANGTTISTPDPYVTGSCEYGAFLKINGKIVTVLPGATFNTTIHLVEGENTITAIATDLVNNVGRSEVKVFLDSTAPTIMLVEPSEGKKTNDMNLTIKGITEKDAFLTINGNAVMLTSVSFQYMVQLVEGENHIVLRASDAVGNTYTKVLTVFLDTTAPSVTITSPRDYVSTNADSILVTGTTEPGATVKINGQTAENVAGVFSKEIKLGTSQNKISVEVSDAVGNSVIKDIHVIKDTIPPELTIQTPTDGQTFNGQTRGKIEVRGKTEAGATIYVNGERAGVAGLTFQTYVYLAEGANTMTVQAYDEAGNIETQTLSIIYDSKVDAQVITPGDVSNTSADIVRCTGFVEPGSNVRINGIEVTVTPEGGFTYDAPVQNGVNTLTFTMTDKAGNQAIITKTVTVSGAGRNPSSSSSMLNALFAILVIVFIIALVIVLMMGRPKKAPAVEYTADNPPPPEFGPGLPPPPQFEPGVPPPPDFSTGGVAPPAYEYDASAQYAAQDQSQYQYPQETYDQGQATVETPQPTAEVSQEQAPIEEPQAVPVKQPEIVEDDEDMKPKKAPIPEDAPMPTMKFGEFKSDEEVAKEAAPPPRKAEVWKKEDKPADVLDEILSDGKK